MGNGKLPHKDYRWFSKDEIQNLNVLEYDADGDYGMILEVDLHYPQHLHDLHRYYPMAPESLDITKDMLSPHVKKCLTKQNLLSTYKTQQRLAPNLYDKNYYVVHIKNLQYYMKNGLELKKIHRVITFYQSRWLKPYIDFNIERRKMVKSEFLSNLYKLICNAVFGECN